MVVIIAQPIKWIWSNKCINPDYGWDFAEDGTLKPKKLGNWVMDI